MKAETSKTLQLALLGVPSSAGARRAGQEEAPRVLREAGIDRSLERLGIQVRDLGDLSPVSFRPDPEKPKARNAELVCRVAREVASRVAHLRDGELPLVLGGDCSITLGVVAGLLDQGSSLGVLYLDGDLDLNTPETTPSGCFDGMVTAHLLGRGHDGLAGIGSRRPLVEEAHLAYFGYNVSAGGIDPPELASLAGSAALRSPIEAVREDPQGSARRVLEELESRVDRILVHFDLDVTDTPAVDVVHRDGLAPEAAARALETFLASPKCAGLVFTEFNPRLDVDGSLGTWLADRLAAALTAARR